MHKIWWFPLETKHSQTIQMPAGARIIHAGLHNSGTLALWAIVDPKAPMIEREFIIYGTDHVIENISSLQFIKTIEDDDGGGYKFMLHLFEKLHDNLPPKE